MVKFTTPEMESLAVAGPGEPEKEPPDPGGEEMGTFGSWSGPKNIFKEVKHWAGDMGCEDKNIGAFFQYCWAFCESDAEEREMFVWMLELVTLYVKEDGWEGFYLGPWKWDWSSFGLRDGWEIPTPDWAQKRELEDILAGRGKVEAEKGSGMGGETVVVEKGDFGKCQGEGEKEIEVKDVEVKEEGAKEENVKEENVREEIVREENVREEKVREVLEKGYEAEDGRREKDAPIPRRGDQDENRGKAAPPLEPHLAAALGTPKSSRFQLWRPWEQEQVEKRKGVLQPEPALQQERGKRKRRSPASQARSRRRLLAWQELKEERVGPSRLQLKQRSISTPLAPSQGVRRVSLVDKFEGKQVEHHLGSTGGSWVNGGESGALTCLQSKLPGEAHQQRWEREVERGEAPVRGGEAMTVSASGFTKFISLRQSEPTPNYWDSPSPPLAPLTPPTGSPGDGWWILPIGVMTKCTSCHVWGPLTPP